MFGNVSSVKTFHCAVRRFFMTTAPISKNNYLGREAKMLNKLMGSSKKKRHFICETPTPSGGTLNIFKQFRNNKENSRRVAVLNKLFIKYISDLLVTGSSSGVVLEKGLAITRVAMSPDFHQLNVFWITNNEKNLDDLEAMLPDLGFNLRHELSQLRVMGVVPRIAFIKDKHHSNALLVESLLRTADFGDDYIPYHSHSDFNDTQQPHSHQENGVKGSEGSSTEDQQSDVENMPVMRQDTFNLDHDKIMKKVMKSMYKTRAVHRFEPNLAIVGEGTNSTRSEVAIDNMTRQQRKQALSKFILERRIQKERTFAKKSSSNLNVPLYENSDIEEQIEYEDIYIEDYIDEDEFVNEKYEKYNNNN